MGQQVSKVVGSGGSTGTSASSKTQQQVSKVVFGAGSRNKNARTSTISGSSTTTSNESYLEQSSVLSSSDSSKTTATPQPPPSNSIANTADPITGFYRGKGPMQIPQDIAQARFLQRQQQQQQVQKNFHPPLASPQPIKVGTNDDMPNDLVQFMKDVGPVKLSSTTTATSSSTTSKRPVVAKRLPRQLRQLQQQQQHVPSSFPPMQHQQQSPTTDGGKSTIGVDSKTPFHDPTRIVSSMRLASNVEGYETTRTTSFSYRTDENDSTVSSSLTSSAAAITVKKPMEVGLSVLACYQLLSQVRHYQQSNNITILNDETIHNIASSFYRDNFINNEIVDTSDDEETTTMIELVKNIIQTTELPIIMKDTDDTYVGASFQNVPTLEQHLQLQVLPKTRIQLVIEDVYTNHYPSNTGTTTKIQQ